MKAINTFSVIELCLFVIYPTPVAPSCVIPPSEWCDSIEIATKCQVLQQCADFVWSRDTIDAASPVNFTVYIESLCPDCKNFVHSQLWPVWNNISSIMALEIVPYGNARETHDGKKWAFECQHGPQECIGNQIETCSIHLYSKTTQHFPFINCIEESTSDANITDVAQKCATQTGLDFTRLMKCSSSPWGNYLEHRMAEKTNSLNPPHQYVPWVTLNGVHTEDIQKQASTNLLKLICDTYQGEKPSACG